MFASPDHWTVEALDAAKAELRKRGLDNPSERPWCEPELTELMFDDGPETDDRPDIYEFFGTYANADARLLLDAFVLEDIGFTLDLNKIGLSDLPPPLAAAGGTFGAGVGIAIGVHFDDYDRAMEIRQRVLKILP